MFSMFFWRLFSCHITAEVTPQAISSLKNSKNTYLNLNYTYYSAGLTGCEQHTAKGLCYQSQTYSNSERQTKNPSKDSEVQQLSCDVTGWLGLDSATLRLISVAVISWGKPWAFILLMTNCCVRVEGRASFYTERLRVVWKLLFLLPLPLESTSFDSLHNWLACFFKVWTVHEAELKWNVRQFVLKLHCKKKSTTKQQNYTVRAFFVLANDLLGYHLLCFCSLDSVLL